MREVLRINRLVDDLHLLSLADSRNLEIRKERIKPLETLHRAAERFRSRFSRQNIAVHFDDPHNGEDMVLSGDEERLEHVFCNLLENTLRYTDSPGELHIRSACSQKEICFVFEDSAPGVPDESLDRLFDRLYRVDKSRSRMLELEQGFPSAGKVAVENAGRTFLFGRSQHKDCFSHSKPGLTGHRVQN
ncbi:MAG: ATP-binding protein [Desulfobacterales bacterium]